MDAESKRILSAPRVEPTAEQLAALVEKWTRVIGRPGGNWTFYPHQALGLEFASKFGGLLAPIDVGGGKTLLALALPRAMGIPAQNTLLLTKAALVAQVEEQCAEYQHHFGIEVPVVMSYGQLSHPDYVGHLAEIAPQLIIADECHMLRNRKAARTRRFLRFMRQHPCAFVAMSGSMTSRSLHDFAHLAELALGGLSPLPTPRRWGTLQAWASCVDDRPQDPPGSREWAMTRHLREWAGEDEGDEPLRDRTRRALWKRIRTMPGVVYTKEPSCSAPLLVHPVQWGDGLDPDVEEALEIAASEYMLPNGDDIRDPLRAAEALRQLSLGFFYYWDWPAGVVDFEWLYARKELAQEVADATKRYAHRGLDSRALVINAARRGEIELVTLPAWDAVKDRPEPPTATAWVSERPLRRALTLAQQRAAEFGTPGIIWSSYSAVKEKLAEWGCVIIQNGERPLINPPPGPGGLVVCSVASHATGVEAQPYGYHMVLSPPANGGAWHQLLGRSHRQGRVDSVFCDVLTHTPAYVGAFEAAVENSEYLSELGETPPRLLTAQIEPFTYTPNTADEVD